MGCIVLCAAEELLADKRTRAKRARCGAQELQEQNHEVVRQTGQERERRGALSALAPFAVALNLLMRPLAAGLMKEGRNAACRGNTACLSNVSGEMIFMACLLRFLIGRKLPWTKLHSCTTTKNPTARTKKSHKNVK